MHSLTAQPAPARADIPASVWQTPTLTPRQVAGLLAEIVSVTPNPQYRPVVVARINVATDRAELYVTDRYGSARVLAALLDVGARPLPAPPDQTAVGDPGILPGIQSIAWWAEKPRKGAA
jgi:hypothetical protein